MQAPANGLSFDISDDNQFKSYVVQQLATLAERTQGLRELHATVPVLEQEVKDLRSNADKREYKQWIHSAAVVIGLTLKNILTHGKF
jgi:hypothetical protein